MKQVLSMTCYTDYPIEALGDEPRKKAKVRRVRVISYDGNKYATVEILGWDVQETIKCGYLYSRSGRCGQVKTVNRRKLERMLPRR